MSSLERAILLDMVQFDPAHNVATLGGEALVFHCHFYNCALQSAIEAGSENAGAILIEAAVGVGYRLLGELAPGAGKDTLRAAETAFRDLGFGVIDMSAITREGGVAKLDNSHYALGWVAVSGLRESPACHFPAGFVAGAFAQAFGHPPSAVMGEECTCFAKGDETCTLRVGVRDGR